MLATVTDKGQVTVPKVIRDRAGIAPGSKLDFQIQDDGSLHVRVLARGARNLFGLLQEPARPPLSIEEMDAGIAETARTRNLPSSA